MKKNLEFFLLSLIVLAGCSEGGDTQEQDTLNASSTTRTARQAMAPNQDTNLWATPAGSTPAGNSGGPTSTCELEVLRGKRSARRRRNSPDRGCPSGVEAAG